MQTFTNDNRIMLNENFGDVEELALLLFKWSWCVEGNIYNDISIPGGSIEGTLNEMEIITFLEFSITFSITLFGFL